jgi:hypothetical protein
LLFLSLLSFAFAFAFRLMPYAVILSRVRDKMGPPGSTVSRAWGRAYEVGGICSRDLLFLAQLPLLLAFAVLLSQRIIRAGVNTKRLSDVLRAAGFFEIRNSPQLIYIPAAFFR